MHTWITFTPMSMCVCPPPGVLSNIHKVEVLNSSEELFSSYNFSLTLKHAKHLLSETIITVCHLTFVSLTGLFGSPKAIWSVKMSIQFKNSWYFVKNCFNVKTSIGFHTHISSFLYRVVITGVCNTKTNWQSQLKGRETSL